MQEKAQLYSQLKQKDELLSKQMAQLNRKDENITNLKE